MGWAVCAWHEETDLDKACWGTLPAFGEFENDTEGD